VQAGMDDFISKPVRKEDLRAALIRVQPDEPVVTAAVESQTPAPADLPILDPDRWNNCANWKRSMASASPSSSNSS